MTMRPVKFTPLLAAGILICLAPASVHAAAKLTEVTIFPTDVRLTTRQDRQSLVVQATFADGVTRDVTAQASYSFADKSLARFENGTVSTRRACERTAPISRSCSPRSCR